MPRDANGNYVLPAGNPVISGTTIESAWANTTMDDIKQALTDSLDRYGRGGMLAPFRFVDGTAGQPGMSWASEISTGFYRAGAGDQRAVVAGVGRMRWTSVGVDVWDSANNQWLALTTAAGGNFALLNAANKFTTAQTVVNTGGAWQIWKDATPTLGARFAFNTNVADNLEVSVFNGSGWRPRFVAGVTNINLYAGSHFFWDEGGNVKYATVATDGFSAHGGRSLYLYNADDSVGMQLVTIGTSGYLAGSVGDITHQVGGSNALTVSQGTVSVLGDRQFRLYNPSSTDYAHLKFTAANNLDFIGPSAATRFDYYLSGGTDWIGSFNKEGFTVKQNTSGFASVRIQKNDTNIGANEGSSLEFYEGGTVVGWLRCFRDGLGKMQLYNASTGLLDISAAGAILFTSGGQAYADMASGGFNMYGGRSVRLYGPGNVTAAALYNDAGSGKAVLKLEGRGGVLHWLSTGLYDSTIEIATAAPGATGLPGTMVLVYE